MLSYSRPHHCNAKGDLRLFLVQEDAKHPTCLESIHVYPAATKNHVNTTRNTSELMSMHTKHRLVCCFIVAGVHRRAQRSRIGLQGWVETRWSLGVERFVYIHF